MSDLTSLMKQAKQMQEQMRKTQEELAKQECTGESGAGLVKVTMNGRHEVKSVEIDQALLSEDREMVEDLLAAAINDAVKHVAENSRSSLSGMAAGLNLPDDFKLPF